MPTEKEKADTWKADQRRRRAFVLARERLMAGDADRRKALADKVRPIAGRAEGSSGGAGETSR